MKTNTGAKANKKARKSRKGKKSHKHNGLFSSKSKKARSKKAKRNGYARRKMHARRKRNDGGGMAALDQLRTRVLDPAFLTACDAGSGDTYDGKVIVNDLGNWTVSGSTIFRTAANANDTTYYNADKLHLKTAGTYQYALSIRGALGLTPA